MFQISGHICGSALVLLGFWDATFISMISRGGTQDFFWRDVPLGKMKTDPYIYQILPQNWTQTFTKNQKFAPILSIFFKICGKTGVALSNSIWLSNTMSAKSTFFCLFRLDTLGCSLIILLLFFVQVSLSGV